MARVGSSVGLGGHDVPTIPLPHQNSPKGHRFGRLIRVTLVSLIVGAVGELPSIRETEATPTLAPARRTEQRACLLNQETPRIGALTTRRRLGEAAQNGPKNGLNRSKTTYKQAR